MGSCQGRSEELFELKYTNNTYKMKQK